MPILVDVCLGDSQKHERHDRRFCKSFHNVEAGLLQLQLPTSFQERQVYPKPAVKEPELLLAKSALGADIETT